MHVGHGARHIPAHLRISHGKERVQAVSVRSPCSERHKCIHIGGPVDQAFKAADKKFLVDHHNRGCKQELDQPCRHMVAFKKRGHGPVPHHMPH